jgi:adenylate kinase
MFTVPVIIITGPIGVGKTTVAGEVSEQLDEAKIAHGCIDIDSLRWCYPRPPHDPFRIELAMKNLTAVWRNFQAVGAERLVLADVIETRAHLEQYYRAIPGAEILVVRLHATLSTLTQHVQQREIGSALTRHLQRATELTAIMERNRVEDMLVDIEEKTVTAIAQEILIRSNWIPAN